MKSAWCTRRLGSAASEDGAPPPKLSTTTSIRRSNIATTGTVVAMADASTLSTAIACRNAALTSTGCHRHCPSTRVAPEHADSSHSLSSSSAPPNRITHCDLCDRLRGRCDPSPSSTRTMDHEQSRPRRDADRAISLSRAVERAASSSSSCASSVVRWSPPLGRPFRWTSQRQLLAWTILFLSVLLFPALADPQKGTSRSSSKEDGVCQSLDIRNNVQNLSKLKGCRTVEGSVQILLIDNAESSEYANISFPELTEITGYLLFYRVKGLRSIGRMFPNLAVIRGHSLFINYALVAFEMMNLQEIGLHNLTTIARGSVRFEKNPALCYVDTIDWDIIAKDGKGENVIACAKA